MTVIEVSTNGREAAYARYVADGGNWTIAQVAAATGLGERRAGDISREWKVRLAATNGSEPSGVSLPPATAPRVRSSTAGAAAARPHRRSAPPTWVVVATKLAVAVVTIIAALLSYSGIRALAIDAGLGWHGDILPLGVDGLVAACLLVRVVHPRNQIARLAMWVALIGSVAANVITYGPWHPPLGIVAAIMAGFMPIAAATGYHLLGRMQVEQ